MGAFSLSSQMLLPVRESHDFSFDNFYGDKNARAKFLLAQTVDQREETLVILSGPEAVGKSHLLNAAIAYAEQCAVHQVCYFSLKELNSFKLSEGEIKALFTSFEAYSILALDDVDLWLQNGKLSRDFKELCLFNLFNHYKIQSGLLVLALSVSLEAANIVLPDLKSRLKSGLIIPLMAYRDEEKERVMQCVANRKGFSLEDGLSAYIIKRSGRNLAELLKLLDRLDKASLTEQRKLTIPFVKKVLNW